MCSFIGTCGDSRSTSYWNEPSVMSTLQNYHEFSRSRSKTPHPSVIFSEYCRAGGDQQPFCYIHTGPSPTCCLDQSSSNFLSQSQRPSCCIDSNAKLKRYACLMPDLMVDYDRLKKRHSQMVTKRLRLWSLSRPRVCNEKYKMGTASCPQVYCRKASIVNLETDVRTRTEQLAYPKVRRVLSLKSHPSYNTFSLERRHQINRTLRKSLLSLYSRLSNTKPPCRPLPPRILSHKERMEHLRYLKRLSKSKWEVVRPNDCQQKQNIIKKLYTLPMKPFQVLRRFKKLAKPRKYEVLPVPQWHLTHEMSTYEASPRLKQLAQARIFDIYDMNDAFKVPRAALTYSPTERIRELAQPAKFYTKTEVLASPFIPARSALKAKTTQRIEELAVPRDLFEMSTRSKAFKVSRAALKAKLTPRLKYLAQPRSRSSR